MARNYTIAEAAQIFANGTDMEAIQDINRRMPVLGYKLAILIGNSDPETVIDFFAGFPAYVTANKLNKAFKEGVPEAEETEAEDDAEETEAEEKPVKKAGKRGVKKADPEPEEDEDDEESDEDDPYAGQTAAALFKECKKRGIKVAPKKDAKFYADKLKADDVKSDDDEDEEEEKPAKKAPAKKAAKKTEDDEDDDWDI